MLYSSWNANRKKHRCDPSFGYCFNPLYLFLSDCAEDEDPGPETTVGTLAGHQQSTYEIEKRVQVSANTPATCFHHKNSDCCLRHSWAVVPAQREVAECNM